MASVTILDVGHGNTALLESDGWVGLVDVSPSATVRDHLEDLSIARIDDVFVSHAESDHAGGLQKLLTDPTLDVGSVHVNPDSGTRTATWSRLRTTLWDLARRGEITVRSELVDTTPDFEQGDLRVEVLHPDLDWALGGVAVGEANTKSVVLRVWLAQEKAVLLAADLTASGLSRIADAGTDVEARVLVFPHHGGHAGGGNDRHFAEDLARSVGPQVVVFSLGRRKESNPQPEIVAGVRAGAPTAHIVCSQLSTHCSEHNAMSDHHLSTRRSAGRETRSCCAGTITIALSGTDLVFEPDLLDHSAFVDSLPVAVRIPLCRRP